MKKSLSILFFLFIVSSTPVFSQEVSEEASQPKKEYSHAQVAATAYVPYFGDVLLSSSLTFLPGDLIGHYLSVESLLLNIPAAIVNPSYTLTGSAISTASWAAGLYLSKYPNLYGNPILSDVFLNSGLKTDMWLEYKGYEKARSMAKEGIYPEYEELSFKDAFFAPYNPNVLSKKSVWIPIAAYSAFLVGVNCFGGFDNSVFKTQESYLGNYKIPIALGAAAVFAVSCFNYTMTGIGEEALFRGTGYEEMKVSFGIVPAKIIDAVIFPAVHIPQQVIAGYDWPSILLTAAVQSGVTFLLQWIYDKGGLKDSIAVHAWIDIIPATLTYLFTTGTQGNNFALNINFSTKL